MLDKAGQPFEGIEERQVLYKGIKENVNQNVTLIEVEEDINDPSVASLIASQLLELMSREKGDVKHAGI